MTLTIHFGPFIPEQIEELRHLLERVEREMATARERIAAVNSNLAEQVFGFSSVEH